MVKHDTLDIDIKKTGYDKFLRKKKKKMEATSLRVKQVN